MVFFVWDGLGRFEVIEINKSNTQKKTFIPVFADFVEYRKRFKYVN